MGGIDTSLVHTENDIMGFFREKDFVILRSLQKASQENEIIRYDKGYIPFKFIEWAQKKGFEIPAPLKIMITPTSKETKYCWLDDAMAGEIINGVIPPYKYFKDAIKYWKGFECISLLHGINPSFFKDHEEIVVNHFTKSCFELDDLIDNAIRFNMLDVYEFSENGRYEHTFEAMAFIQWANSININIPEPFKEMIGCEICNTFSDDNQEKKISKPLSPPAIDHPSPVIDEPQLLKTEAQELGRLRNEKENWDSSLKAAIAIGQWIGTLEYKLTRKTLKEFMQKEFPSIEGKTMDNRLWKSIPENVKNNGQGSPKQPMKDPAK